MEVSSLPAVLLRKSSALRPKPDASGAFGRQPPTERGAEPRTGAFGPWGERTWLEPLPSSESRCKSQASASSSLRAKASAGPREPNPRRANPVFGSAESVKGASCFRAAGVWAPTSSSMEQAQGSIEQSSVATPSEATDFAMEQSLEAEGSPETS